MSCFDKKMAPRRYFVARDSMAYAKVGETIRIPVPKSARNIVGIF